MVLMVNVFSAQIFTVSLKIFHDYIKLLKTMASLQARISAPLKVLCLNGVMSLLSQELSYYITEFNTEHKT